MENTTHTPTNTPETSPERWGRYVAYNQRLGCSLMDQVKLYGPEAKRLNDGRYELLWLSIAACIPVRIPAPTGWMPRKFEDDERKVIYAFLAKATQLQVEIENGDLPFEQERMKKAQVRFLFFLMESALESERMWLDLGWLEMF